MDFALNAGKCIQYCILQINILYYTNIHIRSHRKMEVQMDVFFLLSFFVEEREFDESLPLDEAGAILAFAVRLLSECIMSEDQQSGGYHVAELIHQLSRVVGCSRRNISFLIDRCQLLRYIHAVLVDRLPGPPTSPSSSTTSGVCGPSNSGSGSASGQSSPRHRSGLTPNTQSSPTLTSSTNSSNSSIGGEEAASPRPVHRSSATERPESLRIARFSKRAKLHAAVCCLHISLDEKNRSRLAEFGELLTGARLETINSINNLISVINKRDTFNVIFVMQCNWQSNRSPINE